MDSVVEQSRKLVTLAIPIYNEAKNLPTLLREIDELQQKVQEVAFELLFVDNHSEDETFRLLSREAEVRDNLKVIRFSRNFGPSVEASISAGLSYSSGDAVAVLYSDLQEPPEIIGQMVTQWMSGKDVIVARYRKSRAGNIFLKMGAYLFYRLQSRLSDFEVDERSGDLRLLDRKVVEVLVRLPEKARYFRGLSRWVGFDVGYVDYERRPRMEGESSSTIRSNFSTALNGLVSTSTRPLRIITLMGFLVSCCAGLLLVLYGLMWAFGAPLAGFTTILSLILLGFGFNFVALGVIGEYIARVLVESKQRPEYVVESKVNFSE